MNLPKHLVATLLGILAAASASAGTLNVAWDNDIVVIKDRGYTNGMRLSWLSNSAESQPNNSGVADRLKPYMSHLPGFKQLEFTGQNAWSLSLQQTIVTPEDIEKNPPDYNDLPFMGYTSLDAHYYRWTYKTIMGYGVSLGVVGRESGAESTQRWFHKMIGSDKPRGWDQQLGTYWQGGTYFQFGHRFLLPDAGSLEQEVMGLGQLSLHTYRSGTQLSGSWRLGKNLPRNFVPDYASLSSTIGLPGMFEDDASGWAIFASIMGEWVAHSFLDTKAEPYRYDQERLVLHGGVGASLHGKNWQLALAFRASTDQESTHDDALTFGTLSATWHF